MQVKMDADIQIHPQPPLAPPSKRITLPLKPFAKFMCIPHTFLCQNPKKLMQKQEQMKEYRIKVGKWRDSKKIGHPGYASSSSKIRRNVK